MIAVPSADTVIELTQVLYLEASLLDEGRYDDWLGMLHDDLEYLAPVQEDVAQPTSDTPRPGQAHELTLFHDNLASLRLRVAKIGTGLSQTENPPSRVVRLITNVQVALATKSEDQPVRSAFLIYRQHRQRDVEILAGHRRDRWRRGPNGWRLAHRTVLFAANVLPVKSLPLFY